MELTRAHLLAAIAAGACRDRVTAYSPGMDIEEIKQEDVWWIQANIPQMALDLKIKHGYGYGYGSGYGSGYGDGYGSGSGVDSRTDLLREYFKSAAAAAEWEQVRD